MSGTGKIKCHCLLLMNMDEKIGNKKDLRDFSPGGLAGLVEELGHRSFRADQAMDWLYGKRVSSAEEMKNLPAGLVRSLASYRLFLPAENERLTSEDGTVKFAFELVDGEVIESVWIPEEDRSTLCISSQAGCRMGCRFCRTGQEGFRRQLTPSEIVGQVMSAEASGFAVNNIVIMGMGEPLANLDAVLAALDVFFHRKGLKFSPSRTTLSTIGPEDKLNELAKRGVPCNLAVSLHSAVAETRARLVPASPDPHKLKAALKRLSLPARSRLTIEMALMGGVNDSLEEARALVRWCDGFRVKVNLIPFNPFSECGFMAPSPEATADYQTFLRNKGITALVRKSRGTDILAACGQLARKT